MNEIPDPAEDFEGCVHGLFAQAVAELNAIPKEVFAETLVLRAAERHLKMKEIGVPSLMEHTRRILLRRVQELPVYDPDYQEPADSAGAGK